MLRRLAMQPRARSWSTLTLRLHSRVRSTSLTADRSHALCARRESDLAALMFSSNAGYGYGAAVEEADDSDMQALFATNFFGR